MSLLASLLAASHPNLVSHLNVEALEPRAMLAADLAVTVGEVDSVFSKRLKTDEVVAQVTITNTGDETFRGRFNLDLFLSRDEQVGNDYQYNSRTFNLVLAPGQSIRPNLNTRMPYDLFGLNNGGRLNSGDYHVRASMVFLSGTADDSATNNTAISSDTLPLAYTFGTSDPRGKNPKVLTMLSPNLTTVTFTIRGPGTGVILTENQQMVLRLDGTTTKTTFSTTVVQGTADAPNAELNGVEIEGSLGTFAGKRVDVIGNFSVGGSLLNIQLATLANSAWSIQGDLPLSGTVQTIINASLDSTPGIKNLTVGSWINTDSSSDIIVTPYINHLTVQGDFAPALGITGAGLGASTPAINRLIVKGTPTGRWDVTGNVNSIQLSQTDDSFSLNVNGDVKSLTVSNTLRGIIAGLNFTSISAGSIVNGSILAGTYLGSDSNIGGTGTAEDTFTRGLINVLKVRGSVSDSTLIAAGLDPVDDRFIDGNDLHASKDALISQLRISGDLSQSSRISAPFILKATVRGRAVDVYNDERFLVALGFDGLEP